MIVFFYSLLVFFVFSAQATQYIIDITVTTSSGKIIEVKRTPEKLPSRYNKDTEILLNIYEKDVTPKSPEKKIDIQVSEINNNNNANLYEIDFSHTDLGINKPGIRIDPFFHKVEVKANEPEPLISRSLILDVSGQKYSLKITRYNSFEERLKAKEGFVIFLGDFNTYHKYFVGLNAGLLLPLGKNFYIYALYPKDPTDPSDTSAFTIKQTRYYQTKAILFASIYPWGIEPEAPLTWRNIHFNLGTEISSSIMKSLYIGIGYDFRFFSINLFGGFYKINELAAGYYVNQDVINKKIENLPLIEKCDKLCGLAVSFPINLAAIFGKILGLI